MLIFDTLILRKVLARTAPFIRKSVTTNIREQTRAGEYSLNDGTGPGFTQNSPGVVFEEKATQPVVNCIASGLLTISPTSSRGVKP